MTAENEAVWNALDEYFARASDDHMANYSLAQPYLNRWGNVFILGGLNWVVWRLEKSGEESVKLAAYGSPERVLDYQLFTLAKESISHLSDIVSSLGNKAGEYLAPQIGTTDEDVNAISAYLLAKDFITTFDERSRAVTRLSLNSQYKHIVGTGCKMAYAWLLYNLGEKSLWESIVYGGTPWEKIFVMGIEGTEKHFNPNKRPDELKEIVCKEIALADGRVLNEVVPEISRRGLLEILALDIASHGRAFRENPNWKRKEA